jgi:hypothetical protein
VKEAISIEDPDFRPVKISYVRTILGIIALGAVGVGITWWDGRKSPASEMLLIVVGVIWLAYVIGSNRRALLRIGPGRVEFRSWYGRSVELLGKIDVSRRAYPWVHRTGEYVRISSANGRFWIDVARWQMDDSNRVATLRTIIEADTQGSDCHPR